MIDLNVKDQHGLTLSHFKIDLNAKDLYGLTLSLWFILMQNINMDWLYFIMIVLNERDQHGLTPFHYPCQNGQFWVETLIFDFETPYFGNWFSDH